MVPLVLPAAVYQPPYVAWIFQVPALSGVSSVALPSGPTSASPKSDKPSLEVNRTVPRVPCQSWGVGDTVATRCTGVGMVTVDAPDSKVVVVACTPRLSKSKRHAPDGKLL